MHPEMERVKKCLAAVRLRTDFVPRVGLILGSGLGAFADELRQVCAVSYKDIPGFPRSTAPGHAGRLVLDWVEDVPVAVLQGRVHYYEGYEARDVAMPARLMAALGAKIFFAACSM